jgi:STAS domain
MRVRALRPHGEPRKIDMVIDVPTDPAGIPGLCERLCAMLYDSDIEVVVCDVAGVAAHDAVTIDTLARLQLVARRCGCRVRLRHACGPLRDLLALTGLTDVLPLASALPVEAGGQAEQREPALGIEEEADPADPIA